MFEYENEIVSALLHDDDDFKRLYDKHDLLKRRVDEANSGVDPVDDLSLENMKKEKLFLKDRMAAIIEDYRRSHP